MEGLVSLASEPRSLERLGTLVLSCEQAQHMFDLSVSFEKVKQKHGLSGLHAVLAERMSEVAVIQLKLALRCT